MDRDPLVDNFINANDIDWSKCVGLTTDCARAMSSTFSDLIARAKAVVPSAQWTQCSLHRDNIAVQGSDKSLKKTLRRLQLNCAKPDPHPLNYYTFRIRISFIRQRAFTIPTKPLFNSASTEIKKAISHKEHIVNKQQDTTNSAIIDFIT